MNTPLKLRYKYQLVFSLVALLLLAACSDSEQKTPAAPGDIPARATDSTTVEAPLAAQHDTAFRPGFFPSFPDTLNGCSSYFTYDTTAMENGKYIFLTNYGDLALIRVDGKDIYLHKDRQESKPPAEDESRDVYRGEGYTVVLETRRIKTTDEVSYYTGILHITGHAVNVRFRVHGEAGC
jgi:hypothetical protein